jgi:uncharacterized membrane protein YbhN (UPF0104 family)
VAVMLCWIFDWLSSARLSWFSALAIFLVLFCLGASVPVLGGVGLFLVVVGLPVESF